MCEWGITYSICKHKMKLIVSLYIGKPSISWILLYTGATILNLMYTKCSPRVPALHPTDLISVRLVLKEKAINLFTQAKWGFMKIHWTIIPIMTQLVVQGSREGSPDTYPHTFSTDVWSCPIIGLEWQTCLLPRYLLKQEEDLWLLFTPHNVLI